MPIRLEAIIMCPVEDTGKNSVKPSIMANIIACHTLIYSSDLSLAMMAKNSTANPANTTSGPRVMPRKPSP